MTITSAVVTGAASGIGHALAVRLAAAGTRLVLADVHAAALAEVAADLVCLNAGIVGTALGAPWEADPSEWDHLLAVNLGGVVNGLPVRAPPAGLGSTRPHPDHASLAGLATFPGGGAYAATNTPWSRSLNRPRSPWPTPRWG